MGNLPSSCNWAYIARKLGFQDEISMWTDLYLVQGMSITELAERFDVSYTTVWNALVTLKIPRRPRGGANRYKPIPFDFFAYLAEHGVEKTAERFRLTRQGVYNRIHKLADGVARAEANNAEASNGNGNGNGNEGGKQGGQGGEQ